MAPKAKGKASVVKKSNAPPIPEATLIYYRECLELLIVPEIDDLVIPGKDLEAWKRQLAKDKENEAERERERARKRRKTEHQSSAPEETETVQADSSSTDEPLQEVVKPTKAKSGSPKKTASPAKSQTSPKAKAAATLTNGTASAKAKSDVPEQDSTLLTVPSSTRPGKIKSPSPEVKSDIPAIPSPDPSPEDIFSKEELEEPPLESFPREKLQSMASMAQSRGRKLKHSGDARVNSNRKPSDPPTPEAVRQLAVLEWTDSLLLYAYSFWCLDLVAGGKDESGKYTRPKIDKKSWDSLYGLLTSVRVHAEKIDFQVMMSLLNLLEGFIVKTTSALARIEMTERIDYRLNTRNISQPDSHSQSNGSRPLPGSTPNSNSAADSPTPAVMTDTAAVKELRIIQEQFSRYLKRLEKADKFMTTSQSIQCLATLRSEHHLHSFADLCQRSRTPRRTVSEPKRPWKFAWGLEADFSYTSMNQAVCFGRALIEHVAVQKKLDYRPDWD